MWYNAHTILDSGSLLLGWCQPKLDFPYSPKIAAINVLAPCLHLHIQPEGEHLWPNISSTV